MYACYLRPARYRRASYLLLQAMYVNIWSFRTVTSWTTWRWVRHSFPGMEKNYFYQLFLNLCLPEYIWMWTIHKCIFEHTTFEEPLWWILSITSKLHREHVLSRYRDIVSFSLIEPWDAFKLNKSEIPQIRRFAPITRAQVGHLSHTLWH